MENYFLHSVSYPLKKGTNGAFDATLCCFFNTVVWTEEFTGFVEYKGE